MNWTQIDEATYGDELREDYYAWTWGDALFVVIDEFQYTMNLPYTPAAGEGSDDAVTGDQWSWTLGQQQFNWFKQIIQNSTARYKFVFSHNMLGGITRPIVGVGAGYVARRRRGGQVFRVGRIRRRRSNLGIRYPTPWLGRSSDPSADDGERRQRLLPRP